MDNKSRTQNSIRNISYGLVVTVINVLVSFISRTALVKTLGAEVMGLNALFTEVIAMLSLTELGVGMAIIYSLYKPLSENNHRKIGQLMHLYRTAYNVIAVVTMIVGLALTPIIHKLITDVDYPLGYIRVVFLLFVVKTASSYLFSYKTSLLNADQKQYIPSFVTAVIKLIMTVVIVICLVATKNYIVYLILLILQSLSTNLVISRYVDKNYSYINYKDKLDKKERKEVFANIKNIFIKRVSGVITSSTDNILISTLVSTVQVGFYSNYVMIFSVIRTLKQQFTNGLAASIGNLSFTETPERCISVLKRLSYLYFMFAIVMTSGLMGVSKEFITIWLGEDYVMSSLVVYVAILNLFIEICCEPIWQYLEVSGLFAQDRNIAIIGSSVNLIVSIVLGKMCGIVGIFLGTVCTQLIQLVLKTLLIFIKKYKKSPASYFWMLIKMAFSYLFIVLFHAFGITFIKIGNIYVSFLLKGVFSVVLAVSIGTLAFLGTDEFKYSLQIVAKIGKKIIKR